MVYRTGKETSPLALAAKRILYEVTAVPSISGVRVFEGLSRFYGLKNSDDNYVIPNPEYIKHVSSSDTVLALDFVAAAFEDFQKLYVEMIQSGKASNESVYTNIIFEPFEGWYNFEEQYSHNIQTLIDQINNIFLSEHKQQKKIKNIDDYIKSFMNFIPLLSLLKITRAKMLSNVLTKRGASGLIIKLVDENENDDQTKVDEYINDLNFKTVVTLAEQTGFYVSKNSPWTLVANLGSPLMKFYMQPDEYEEETKKIFDDLFLKEQQKAAKDNIPMNPDTTEKLREQAQKEAKKKIMSTKFPIEDIFEKYYFETAFADFNTIKNMFYYGYTSFFNIYPEARNVKFCPIAQKTIQVYTPRKYISEEEYDQKFDDKFFLKAFLVIKNYEVGKIFSKRQMQEHLKQIYLTKKRVDTSAAIMYINSIFKAYMDSV